MFSEMKYILTYYFTLWFKWCSTKIVHEYHETNLNIPDIYPLIS